MPVCFGSQFSIFAVGALYTLLTALVFCKLTTLSNLENTIHILYPAFYIVTFTSTGVGDVRVGDLWFVEHVSFRVDFSTVIVVWVFSTLYDF